MPLTKESESSETSTLIDASFKTEAASKSFIIANTLGTEIKLISQGSLLIALQMLCQLGSPVIAMIFVGQLADSALYISGVGLARTFVSVTATANAWYVSQRHVHQYDMNMFQQPLSTSVYTIDINANVFLGASLPHCSHCCLNQLELDTLSMQ